MGAVLNITVTKAESGPKLLQFLRRRLTPTAGAVPDSMLHRIIRSGEVRVNGRRATPFQRVESGQSIRIPPIRTAKERAGPDRETTQKRAKSDAAQARSKQPNDAARHALALTILAETPDLLVLFKPAGLPTHPGTGHTDSLTARLAARYAHAAFMPTPAHRLDKDTSGIVLAAKTYARLARLHDLFAQKSRAPNAPDRLRKEYLAWVRGAWRISRRPVFLEDTLGKKQSGPCERMERMEKGRAAKALALALEVHENRTLLLITLLTGRTHQIRTQLALRGYPIIGDRKYGAADQKGPMLLHAWRITLPDGEQYRADPAWPDAFDVSRALKSLET